METKVVTPSIPPTKQIVEPTKRVTNRLKRESNKQLPKRKYNDRINLVDYDPLEYVEPPIEKVFYDADGYLDTQKNRIRFSESNWYAQFQYFRELLARQSSSDESFRSFVKEYTFIHYHLV